METIPKSDCQKIGFIRKTHGVHGEVVLEFDPEFEESVAGADRFFLEIDGLLVPFFVAENGLYLESKKTALICFDWVNTKTYARRLVSGPVYLYSNETNRGPDDSAAIRLLNFRLLNENAKEMGTITAVDNYSGNIVLTVLSGDREMLVPFNRELLVKIDKEEKILMLRLPAGLSD